MSDPGCVFGNSQLLGVVRQGLERPWEAPGDVMSTWNLLRARGPSTLQGMGSRAWALLIAFPCLGSGSLTNLSALGPRGSHRSLGTVSCPPAPPELTGISL